MQMSASRPLVKHDVKRGIYSIHDEMRANPSSLVGDLFKSQALTSLFRQHDLQPSLGHRISRGEEARRRPR